MKTVWAFRFGVTLFFLVLVLLGYYFYPESMVVAEKFAIWGTAVFILFIIVNFLTMGD